MRAYPSYKNSHVSWLGPVPSHWRIGRSDQVLRSRALQVEAESFQGETVFHYSIPAVQEIGTGQLEDGSTIKSAKLLISAPQILVSKLNPRKGTVCIAEPQANKTVCSGEFVPLEVLGADQQFFFYIVSSDSYRQRLESKVESATRSHQRVNPADIVKFDLALPPLTEQQAIAAFLDRETGKIDALVEEQRRLIALLKEKRQAVISHAVTKGLDPAAPMKPSGIDWLGDIPAHWDMYKFGRILERIEQGWSPIGEDREPEEGEVGVLKLSAIKAGIFKPEERKAIPIAAVEDRMASLQLNAGDLLLTRANTPDLVGDVAIVPDNLSPTIFSDLVYRLGLRHEVVRADFLCLMLRSTLMRAQIKADARGSSMSMAKLSHGHIRSWQIALPPLEEQAELAAFCEEQEAKLLALTAEATRAIALLQERRAALISAAVTGKIDVRDTTEETEAA